MAQALSGSEKYPSFLRSRPIERFTSPRTVKYATHSVSACCPVWMLGDRQ